MGVVASREAASRMPAANEAKRNARAGTRSQGADAFEIEKTKLLNFNDLH